MYSSIGCSVVRKGCDRFPSILRTHCIKQQSVGELQRLSKINVKTLFPHWVLAVDAKQEGGGTRPKNYSHFDRIEIFAEDAFIDATLKYFVG
jgi:hypothetical protein